MRAERDVTTRKAMRRRMAALTGLAMVVLLATASAHAAPDLPVLRANSRTLDVRDGDVFLKGDWIADPSVALDTYLARRASAPRRVVFISDLDSLALDVAPGRTYDFVVVLGGGDTCRTRLSTLAQGAVRTRAGAGPDTIPIAIRHGKLRIRGTVNGSKPLDLIFDTGAEICALYPSARGKGALLQFDGTLLNAGKGGTTRRQTSSDNRLDVAGLRWEREAFVFIERQADQADGIAGYPLFQDKVVELDYERMLMIVHDALPAAGAGHARTALSHFGALPTVEIAFDAGGRKASGQFILDTAGGGSLNANEAFASAQRLAATLPSVGSSTSRGVGPRGIRNRVVLLPTIELAGFVMHDVPIHLEQPGQGNGDPPVGTVNMEVLGRFHTWLDFPGQMAYFAPNAHFAEPFKRRTAGPPPFVLPGLGALALALAVALAWRARKRQHTALPPGS